MEPELSCIAALLSPETGIIDSHAFMLRAAGRSRRPRRHDRVRHAGRARSTRMPAGWRVHFGGKEPGELEVDAVVNCGRPRRAGAGAPHRGLSGRARAAARARARAITSAIARPAGVLAADLSGAGRRRPRHPRHARSRRAACASAPTSSGSTRRTTTSIRSARSRSTPASARYWPGLPDDSLLPDYAGIRPKLTGPGEPAADFMIEGPAQHGLPGLIHMFGIESPGLTSSLSLAEEVVAAICE